MLLKVLTVVLFLPLHIAASLPPAACDDDRLTVDGNKVRSVIEQLPTWENDPLARYEQPELFAVRLDIKACESAPTHEDFFIDVQQLGLDLGALVSLDNVLSTRKVS